MPAPRRRVRAAGLVAHLALAVGVLVGCSGADPLGSPDAGRSAAYEPGLPSFDLEAIPDVRGGVPGVTVHVSLPHASLVFAASESGFVARYALSLQVENERGVEASAAFGDTLRVGSADAGQSYERERHTARFEILPGVYVVQAVLEDEASGERAVRRQRVEVEGLTGSPRLGVPLVSAERERWSVVEPVVALHVPAYRDSLRLSVAAYDAPGGRIDLTLSRLRADTSVAFPPFWIAPPRGSLAVRGYRAEPVDTLFVAALQLPREREADAAFALPRLGQGLYRADLILHAADGTRLDRRHRLLSVKGEAFPRLATLAELVEALAYIAYPRERAFIAEGASAAERRRRFDAFWGALVEDRRVASNLLRLYYERVEDANRLFTSVKPGWKTDRGMTYVVFGPPVWIEETFGGEVWHYGFGGEGAAFAFEHVDFYGAEDPFSTYVLVRQPAYERAWTRAIERWRAGRAL